MLGGSDNALSIGRSLGRRDIPVYSLAPSDGAILRSRHIRSVDVAEGADLADTAGRFLSSPAAETLAGALILALSDDAIEYVSEHRSRLADRFRLDLSDPAAARTMLDKRSTYEAARAAGVPTPRFWPIEGTDDLAPLEDGLVYPLIVKPTMSHLFQARHGRKFVVAEGFDEVHQAVGLVAETGSGTMLVERIPGPDTNLCSYYSWLDDEGAARFDFTKRIIRRHPPGMGLATYHVTDDVPGVREPALTLAAAVGLRGLLNVEFKLDERDGVLKLIECNARFTAGNALVERAGIDLAGYVYHQAVGGPLPAMDHFRSGLTMWDPVRDLAAHRSLRRSGRETHRQWLRSVVRRHAVHPTFSLSDPLPWLVRTVRRLGSP